VEFAAVDRPKKALMYSGATLQGRSIMVSILEPCMEFSLLLLNKLLLTVSFSIEDDSIKGSLTGKTICLKDCIAWHKYAADALD